MAKIDLRVRLLRRLIASRIADMDDDDIARTLGPFPRNPLVDQLLGKAAAGVTIEDGTAAGVPVRSYRPDTAGPLPLPLVLNMHGGGHVVGYHEQCDWLCSSVAATVGAVVVSIRYRTAPAHPWPAAAEDCYAVLVETVGGSAELGADPQRVAVMGDSAGGNLAAVLALMARDQSGPAIGYQVLHCPILDFTLSSSSLDEVVDVPVLSRRDVVASRDHYLGGQDLRHPYASPLFAPDLSGLPPALIQVAEHDPIRDDGLRYAKALRDAGVQVRATTYVGMPHDFFCFPKLCRSAPQALAEVCATLSGDW